MNYAVSPSWCHAAAAAAAIGAQAIDVCTEPSRSEKKSCVWQLTQFLLPGKEFREK